MIRVFFILILLLSGGIFGQTPSPTNTPPKVQSDDEIISVDTTLVNIPVSVFDKKGQVITNLSQTDFRIFEDGIEQKIEYFAPVEQPFTVVLLLDVSGSVRNKLGDIKKSALAFIDQLKPNDRVVGMTFDTSLKILNKDLRDREGLRKAINDIQSGSGTFLYATVEAISNRILKRFTGRKALILFTDGEDGLRYSNARSTYQTSLSEAESSGALIYCIQFQAEEAFAPPVQTIDNPYVYENPQKKIAYSYLSELSLRSGGKLYQARKIKELEKAFASIAQELRWQYSIGYYPQNTDKTNERKQIKVEVKQPNLFIKSRQSYTRK